jgi:hypothetical protein
MNTLKKQWLAPKATEIEVNNGTILNQAETVLAINGS